jgi:hypothetical protein
MLWNHWWNLVCDLRSACARTRTFLWMALCLAGMATRKELLGVTSIIRALGLEPACYDRLLDFFHSPALNLHELTRAWCALVFRAHPGILRVNGRPVLAGDGIKVAKAGRKMPGVKKLHQQSESNTKPEYIFGHSCQAVADPSLVQRFRLAFGLSHPRGHGLFQPRPQNPAGQDDPADRLTGNPGAVLLRGRRLLRNW